MRNRFDNQLEKLNNELIEMGSMIEQAIEKAISALVNNDVELAKTVIEGDEDIDHQERRIESLCMKLLLQQQPVAKDFRLISSALKMITQRLPSRCGRRHGDRAGEARLHRHARHRPHGQRHRVHLRRAARAHTSMAHPAHVRARAHDQRGGHRGRRARRVLPRQPVRHRHPREFEGLRGKLAVAARRGLQAEQPARQGLRGARRGGAPWLNPRHRGSPSPGCLTGAHRSATTTPSRGSPSKR